MCVCSCSTIENHHVAAATDKQLAVPSLHTTTFVCLCHHLRLLPPLSGFPTLDSDARAGRTHAALLRGKHVQGVLIRCLSSRKQEQNELFLCHDMPTSWHSCKTYAVFIASSSLTRDLCAEAAAEWVDIDMTAHHDAGVRALLLPGAATR